MVGTSGLTGLEKRMAVIFTADVKNFLSGTSKVNASIKEIRNTAKGTTQTINKTFDQTGKVIGQTLSVVKDFRNKFNFSFLSTMFFGMQLQRTFGGIVKSAVSAFKEIASATHPVSIAFARLDANLNFLKFVLIDAFGPSLINNLSKFINKLSALPGDKIKSLADSILNLAVLGGILFAGSQLALLLQGLKSFRMPGLVGFVVFSLLIKELVDSLSSFETGEITEAFSTLGSSISDVFKSFGELLGFAPEDSDTSGWVSFSLIIVKSFNVIIKTVGLVISSLKLLKSKLLEGVIGGLIGFALGGPIGAAIGAGSFIGLSAEAEEGGNIIQSMREIDEAVTELLEVFSGGPQNLDTNVSNADESLKDLNTTSNTFISNSTAFNESVEGETSAMMELVRVTLLANEAIAAHNRINEEGLIEAPSISTNDINAGG